MSKRRCAKCGRIYPDSYRRCPYCSGEDGGRRSRPESALEQAVAALRYHKDRIFLICTAVFLLIAILGIVLTRCSSTEPKPVEKNEPPKQDTTAPEPEPAPEPLALSAAALALYVDETAQLTITGGDGDPIWTTSDPTVASVDNGTVSAKAAGTATVSAACGLQKVSCTVTVKVKGPDVEVYLNRTDFTLRSGEDFTMKVKVKETRKDYEGTVVWSCADTSVATISETGLVERVGKGTTTVTATMGDKVLECIVRVS